MTFFFWNKNFILLPVHSWKTNFFFFCKRCFLCISYCSWKAFWIHWIYQSLALLAHQSGQDIDRWSSTCPAQHTAILCFILHPKKFNHPYAFSCETSENCGNGKAMYLFCVCISNQKLINYFNNFLICTEVIFNLHFRILVLTSVGLFHTNSSWTGCTVLFKESSHVEKTE